ncbi:uncharacterized protein ARMOST_06530 [Armillaria ostoyae]|uniref:Uncharacterized protein n=1 Tax=Armillaria ostoyae TaxID=47428 RepID=A0A284R389_ARMOS|nr:uncharacterized protein ARMOST_06530 [Armillaria ostoyae]
MGPILIRLLKKPGQAAFVDKLAQTYVDAKARVHLPDWWNLAQYAWKGMFPDDFQGEDGWRLLELELAIYLKTATQPKPQNKNQKKPIDVENWFEKQKKAFGLGKADELFSFIERELYVGEVVGEGSEDVPYEVDG